MQLVRLFVKSLIECDTGGDSGQLLSDAMTGSKSSGLTNGRGKLQHMIDYAERPSRRLK
jgi:hypothetical protein